MDTAGGIGRDRFEQGERTPQRAGPAIAIGGDERRMHVRAYNHWVALLDGRPYPSVADLDAAALADFGPHGVLIDFTAGLADPTIAFLGGALRDECGVDASIVRIADVPARSLLSRLTDHYLEIIANRAPVGFEAEFVGTRGHSMAYRGILMPLSSDGEAIDFVYGVINWKEMVDATTQASIEREVSAALAAPLPPAPIAPVWADGPLRSDAPVADDLPAAEPLAATLDLARQAAALADEADARSRAALNDALGAAHDLALASDLAPDDFRLLLAEAGIAPQTRARPAVAQLVFGAHADPARVRTFAALLDHANDAGVPRTTLASYLAAAGGIEALVA